MNPIQTETLQIVKKICGHAGLYQLLLKFKMENLQWDPKKHVVGQFNMGFFLTTGLQDVI